MIRLAQTTNYLTIFFLLLITSSMLNDVVIRLVPSYHRDRITVRVRKVASTCHVSAIFCRGSFFIRLGDGQGVTKDVVDDDAAELKCDVAFLATLTQ